MNKIQQQSLQSGIDINQLSNESSSIHPNVSQNYIVITEDKLELFLIRHQNTLKAKNDWKTPFGIFLALLASLIAADFSTFLSLSADTWQAIFILGCIISFGWLVKTLIFSIKYRNKSDIKSLLDEIKQKSE